MATGPDGATDPDDRPDRAPASPDHTTIRFLVALGAAMTQAGTAVDEVQRRLEQIAAARGMPDTEIVALPTLVVVQSSKESVVRAQLGTISRAPIRFDQISRIDGLVRAAEAGSIGAEAGIDEVAEIMRAPSPMPLALRILGMGLLSGGFALLLQPTATSALLAVGLGLAVGILVEVRVPQLQAVAPVVIAFLVGVVVFALADRLGIDNPIRVLMPPLIPFLPGLTMTTATMELASGQTLSGAGRLIEGIVTLLLLALGIVAAASVVHISPAELIDDPTPVAMWLAPAVGVLLIAAGQHFHYAAPRRLLGWMVVVMAVAYAGQAVGAAIFVPELSGFFGALAMTPLTLWLGSRPDGPPEMTLFVTGYWLLVPGATGLISVTAAVGAPGVASGSLTSTAVTIGSITLGVLLGASLWKAGDTVTTRFTR